MAVGWGPAIWFPLQHFVCSFIHCSHFIVTSCTVFKLPSGGKRLPRPAFNSGFWLPFHFVVIAQSHPFFARVIFDLSKHVSPPVFFAACPCWPLNPLNPSAPSRRFSDWIHMVICAVFCILFIHKTAESFSRTNNRPCLNFFV